MSVTVDFQKTVALKKAVNSRSAPMMKWKRQAAQLYRSQLFKRFDRFSRGLGNWRNTKRRRAGKTKFILRKTHTLYKSLSPVWRGLPGQYQKINRDSIEVGIKGGKHPEFKGTVGQLAAIHNRTRQIMVRPDSRTRDLQRARLESLLKKRKNG